MATDPHSDHPIGDSVSSTWDVLIAYVKQETLVPLQGIGKRIGMGMLGALVAGIGVIELILALLRALQGVEQLEGGWSWAPYLLTLAVVVLVTAIVLKIIEGRRAQA